MPSWSQRYRGSVVGWMVAGLMLAWLPGCQVFRKPSSSQPQRKPTAQRQASTQPTSQPATQPASASTQPAEVSGDSGATTGLLPIPMGNIGGVFKGVGDAAASAAKATTDAASTAAAGAAGAFDIPLIKKTERVLEKLERYLDSEDNNRNFELRDETLQLITQGRTLMQALNNEQAPDELRDLIKNANKTLVAAEARLSELDTAAVNETLADTRAVLADLKPVLADLKPMLADVRDLLTMLRSDLAPVLKDAPALIQNATPLVKTGNEVLSDTKVMVGELKTSLPKVVDHLDEQVFRDVRQIQTLVEYLLLLAIVAIPVAGLLWAATIWALLKRKS